ncbi:MAG: metallophosphoesterase family protein [Deltaproteobacteria bacterium]|nr:MAG: metallophosphoesterase family protein [Deltaproteobacteria bacterium]
MQLADGVATTTLTLPPDTRALSMSFIGADGRTDDNGGEDYHSGALFPYIGPFLTPGSDGGLSTRVTVTWETDRRCKGVVLYGDDPEHLDRQAVGTRPDTIHHVELADLRPGATVHYRVTECGTGRRSEVHAFHTIADDATTLDVAVLADMQDKGTPQSRWGEIARHVAQAHGEVDLVLAPGDLAADDEPRFWWLFFDRARDLLASTPLVPAVGNHDTPGRQSNPDDSSFLRYFPVPRTPGAGGVYATRAGPLVVLTLNSEVPSELHPGGAQYRWVEQQLADTRGDRWVFAQWHVPPFNAGGRFARVQDDTRPVTALFDGRVDWVFTGHEHLYQRTLPLRAGRRAARYGRGDEDGVGYIVAPTAGDRIFDTLAPLTEPSRSLLGFPTVGNLRRVEGEHGYLVVHIDGPDIGIRSWGMGRTPGQPATVVDEIAYRREE